MTATSVPYDWRDRLVDLTRRPMRLAAWTAIFAVAFFSGRIFLFATIAVFALVRGIRTRKSGGGRLTAIVVIGSVLFFVAHLISFAHSRNVDRFVDANTPVELSRIPNGVYPGSGMGTNGTVELEANIRDGRIAGITLSAYRDPVYAFDQVLDALAGARSTDLHGLEGFVFRNPQSLGGFQAALNDALVSRLPDYPKPDTLSRATFFFTSNRLGRITINALAILFIAIITLDFFIQPTLARGTGQSLNCYNCQACVGVCPVKMVAGDPFPMIMVIESRAGNYDKVASLAKYCVGCGKCAAKCPVGNSGPSVASSSYLLWREQIRRDKRKQTARLRQWPTLDDLSGEPNDEG